MPVVVGALGSVSKSLIGHLEQLGIPDRSKLSVQKSALLDRDISLKRCLESQVTGLRPDWMMMMMMMMMMTMMMVVHNAKVVGL